MVKVCVFILYLYRHERIASDKNVCLCVQISSCSNSHCLTPQHVISCFCFGQCKLLGYFHVKYPFFLVSALTMHFPMFFVLLDQTQPDYLILPGFMTYPVMSFDASVLSKCHLWKSLLQRLNFLLSISMSISHMTIVN